MLEEQLPKPVYDMHGAIMRRVQVRTVSRRDILFFLYSRNELQRDIRAEESDFDQAAMEMIKPRQLKDLVPVVRTFQCKLLVNLHSEA